MLHLFFLFMIQLKHTKAMHYANRYIPLLENPLEECILYGRGKMNSPNPTTNKSAAKAIAPKENLEDYFFLISK